MIQYLLTPTLTSVLLVASFPWAVFLIALLVNGGPEDKVNSSGIGAGIAFSYGIALLVGLGLPKIWPAFLMLWALINVPFAAILILLPEKIWENARKARKVEEENKQP